MPWAVGTCIVLLIASGVLALDGHSGAVAPGIDGFRFGFFNHALGMIAGALLGLAVPARAKRRTRLSTGAVALIALVAGLVVGLARWA